MDTLNAGDQRILTAALQVFAGENLANLKVNYDELARAAGLKSANSAQVLFCKAKRNFLAAVKAKNGTQDDTTAKDATHKKVSGDKVTKTPRKSPAKGKGKGKGATKDEPEAMQSDETPAAEHPTKEEEKPSSPGVEVKLEDGVDNASPMEVVEAPKASTKISVGKGKPRGNPKKRLKAEPTVDTSAPVIKTEPGSENDPGLEAFANGILEGTQYPQTKESWIQADAIFYEAQAYLSMSEGSSTSGSGFSTPVTE